MAKNIIFIVNISEQLKQGRNDKYDLSINSWKSWADTNDCEVFVLTERVYPENYMNANWHKALALKLLESNGVDYDQVLIVDADTIVHPNCPNFFDETEDKFCAVMNDGCYEWTMRSIKRYGDHMFPGIKISPWEYFNTGFVIVNKSHKEFLDKVIDNYNENIEKYIQAKEFKVGNDQTPLNFFTKMFDVDVKILPPCYNLQDMFRKNLLHIPGHSWWKDELVFLNAGWVYHFNAIPQNDRDANYWIERTYRELYG